MTHKEILGSISVKEHRFFGNGKKFRMVFTRDRILGVKTDGERNALAGFIDQENGLINRSDVLAADRDNFDIPYIQVRDMRMKKLGVLPAMSQRIGEIVIETYESTLQFDIEHIHDYATAVKLLDEVLGEKFTNLSPEAVVKYCPECGEEYQGWVTTCPDCGVALTDEPPEFDDEDDEEEDDAFLSVSGGIARQWHKAGAAGTPDNTMVSIATAPNLQVAEMWKGLLDEEGISCMVLSPMGEVAEEDIEEDAVIEELSYEASTDEESIDILVLVRDIERVYEILEPFLNG